MAGWPVLLLIPFIPNKFDQTDIIYLQYICLNILQEVLSNHTDITDCGLIRTIPNRALNLDIRPLFINQSIYGVNRISSEKSYTDYSLVDYIGGPDHTGPGVLVLIFFVAIQIGGFSEHLRVWGYYPQQLYKKRFFITNFLLFISAATANLLLNSQYIKSLPIARLENWVWHVGIYQKYHNNIENTLCDLPYMDNTDSWHFNSYACFFTFIFLNIFSLLVYFNNDLLLAPIQQVNPPNNNPIIRNLAVAGGR